MKTSDLFLMSVRNLWRRKLRSFLTILGVIIGTCSIVLMVSLGIAMDTNFENQIEQMGSLTVISVRGKQYEDAKAPKLDDKAIKNLSKLEYVERVIPTKMSNAYLTYKRYRTNWDVQIAAMSAEDMKALGYEAVQGRDMREGEKGVIILAGNIPMEFTKIGKRPNYNQEPEPMEFQLDSDKIAIEIADIDGMTGKPITEGEGGKKVKAPKPLEAKIIGILSDTNYDNYGIAYVSTDIYEELVKEKEKYQEKLYGKQQNQRFGRNNSNKQGKYEEIKVKVSDREQVTVVQDKIKEMNFVAYSSMDQLNEMKKISGGIQMTLGGIGAITLLVAAIGITNTMMMSIYERTREIGIMKVIGAKISDIQKMFLVEALLIGSIGGTTGIIISYALSALMNMLGGQFGGMMGMENGKISMIPIWLALGAVLFSTIIGLIAGYFPSRKAMKLSALSAIKTE